MGVTLNFEDERMLTVKQIIDANKHQDAVNNTNPRLPASSGNSELLLRELLSEAIYCLELCRPSLPKVYAAGNMQRSALAARVDSLIEHTYSELDTDFEKDVLRHGL